MREAKVLLFMYRAIQYAHLFPNIPIYCESIEVNYKISIVSLPGHLIILPQCYVQCCVTYPPPPPRLVSLFNCTPTLPMYVTFPVCLLCVHN